MDKPKVIKEVVTLRNRISKLKELVDYYELMSSSIGGPNYDAERIDKTRDLDAPFVKWILKKLDAEAEIKELENELSGKVNLLIETIDNLESIDEKTVLTLRYVQNLSWDKIEEKTYYSRSSVFRFHRNGLENLLQSEVGT